VIKVRKSHERGFNDLGWLKTYHSFSFADYHDPRFMGFRALRVINEDFIAGGGGFPMHGHRDMEIITYVVDGALEHEDSHGHSGVIRRGDVQRMSAGRGVLHSEFNHERGQAVHLFQIWILPRTAGGDFSYKQKSFERDLSEKKLVLVASGDPREGAIPVNQDVDFFISRLKAGDSLQYEAMPERALWLQVASGQAQVDGFAVGAGDGVALSGISRVKLGALEDSELLIFDLA